MDKQPQSSKETSNGKEHSWIQPMNALKPHFNFKAGIVILVVIIIGALLFFVLLPKNSSSSNNGHSAFRLVYTDPQVILSNADPMNTSSSSTWSGNSTYFSYSSSQNTEKVVHVKTGNVRDYPASVNKIRKIYENYQLFIDDTISVVDIASGEQLLTVPGMPSGDAVLAPDHHALAVTTANGVELWDLTTKQHHPICQNTNQSFPGFDSSQKISLYWPSNSADLYFFQQPPNSGFSSTQNVSVVLGACNSVQGNIEWSFSQTEHADAIGVPAFSPDNQHVLFFMHPPNEASRTFPYQIFIVETATGRVQQIESKQPASSIVWADPTHILLLSSATLSNVAASSPDNASSVWDITNGQLVNTLFFDGVVNAPQFSPDYQYFAFESIPHEDHALVTIYRTVTNERVTTINAKSFTQDQGIRWLPDNKHIVTIDDHGQLDLWNITGKHTVQTQALDPTKNYFLYPSLDGKAIAAIAKPQGTIDRNTMGSLQIFHLV